MDIFIEQRDSPFKNAASYIVTLPAHDFNLASQGGFPVLVNGGNAEQLILSLNALSYHPQVYQYIRELIPSPFYPSRTMQGSHLPVDALLNYLAGPSNIHCVDWANSIEYIKGYKGVIVRHFSKHFVFPDHTSFTTSFINSYGAFQWSNRWFHENISDYLFLNQANNNVAQIVESFASWFVNKSVTKFCVRTSGTFVLL